MKYPKSLSFCLSSHLWSWGFPSGQSRGCCLVWNGTGNKKYKVVAGIKKAKGFGSKERFWYTDRRGVVDEDREVPHTAVIITPRQTLQWEKENENRFVTQSAVCTGECEHVQE